MHVLVVGAGPVGLSLAFDLVRRGVDVRIIDKEAAPSGLSKALALHARSMELLEQAGIAQDFLDQGFHVQGLTAHLGRGGRPLQVDFAHLDSPFPFILDIPQYRTEAILTRHLEGLGVGVERGVELVDVHQDPDAAHAVLRDAHGGQEAVEVPWLVACDGAHSTVRHRVGIPFAGTQYPETFLLGDVRVQWSLAPDRAHVYVDTTGLLAAFPYGDQRYRLMATAPTPAGTDDGADPTFDALAGIARARCPVDLTLSAPTWITWFHSHLRRAAKIRVGRIFLLGDAAHIHSPAGGQGMNTGIQDAFNLGWKLALVIGGSASRSLLDSFAPERSGVAEAVLRLSDGLLRTATSHGLVARLLRDHVARLLVHAAPVQRRITRQIAEVAVDYRRSPIVQERRTGRGWRSGRRLRAGDRVPDVRFADGQGEGHRVYRLLTPGIRHTVLVFGGGAPAADRLGADLARWREHITICHIGPGHGSAAGNGWAAVSDPQGAVRARWGLPPQGVVIVRPDGYAGFVGEAPEPAAVLDYFRHIFEQPAATGATGV